jgi:Gpi18-like mannosyltransferase
MTTSKENSRILKFILTVFVLWQVALTLVSFVADCLPKRYNFMYNDGPKTSNPRFFWKTANFDGIHYLNIARNGYGMYEQAFFPLYPELIKKVTPLFSGKDLTAGLAISNISFIALLFLFYKLIKLDFNDKTARKTIIFLVLFPASFFFGMVYTESLFLLLVLASFYSARKGKWLLSGLLAALAANTRLIGVFLLPALLYEFYLAKTGKKKISYLKSLSLFLAPVGLFCYMNFLRLKYNDPLMFFHVQPFFGAGRSGGKLILIYQVFFRYLKMILTTYFDPLYFAVWLELLVAIGFLALGFLAFRNKIRSSYLIFSLLAYLVPTLTGTFSSLPRYALVLFPCFIYLGTIKKKIIEKVLVVVFSICFIVALLFFYRGYWVA